MDSQMAWIVMLHLALGAALGIRVALMRFSARKQNIDPAKIQLAARVHANFVEWVPLTLLGLFASSALGTHPSAVLGLGIGLFVARLAHAWGYSHNPGPSVGRFVGISLNFLVIGLILASVLVPGPWRP